MQFLIDPLKERKPITMAEDICYSRVTDLDGKSLELTMSILTSYNPRHSNEKKSPAIIWINGHGWRTAYSVRNQLIPELVFLADCGYTVVNVYYRSSVQGKFPAQIIDIKTAIRFLRAHAETYHIDPERIGVYGRSAGGHLASFAAMNTNDFISDEWSGYSSGVQAACDMFGPVDLEETISVNMKKIKNPKFRWHSIEETYDAMLLGWDGDINKLLEKARTASPIRYINENMCDILIMHGAEDDLVPLSVSEKFYKKIVECRREKHADFYILAHGKHGSPDFYQSDVRKIIVEFFDKNLKRQ